ncbi:phosphatidate cytidylyltransferase [Taibaiella chishuiensis]|uniref:Phosphatidate cytidylyltransferase n=1 Tax=Taibaiella chishuiensis TaxID=1434707 RepID=A0A2P8CZG8_9BACT|nr:phosphatidate cytidylyltransferase [Taibaiella chishuiensis]PSK90362.1 hypothetical protein B0I18_10892 [Taibaiella chishuiensis]
MKRNLALLFLLLPLLFTSCSVIGGIFKAGAYTGIIAVVVVLVIIGVVIGMLRKRN